MAEQYLTGKRAVVTGGVRGIGKAIAEELRDRGAAVIVTGTTEGTEPPRGCAFEAVDFLDAEGLSAFAQKLGEKIRPDIFINNAGINKISPFAEIEEADFDAIQAINVRAPLILTKAVLPVMRERAWGRIIGITSIFGSVTKEFRAPYSTSKFGLDGMMAALAAEVARDNILVNCVGPGFIKTDLTRRVLGEKGMAEMAARVPMGRFGEPEEIAAFVAWLVSPMNTYVSGQNLLIDGGFSRV